MFMKRWSLILVLGILSLLVTACSGPDEHIWLKSPGWSRAVFLGGTAFSELVPVVIDETNNMFFVLVEKEEDLESSHFRVLAFNQNVDALWERSLTDISLMRPSSVQIMLVDGGLQLFWIDQEQLYMLELDSEGHELGAPVLLSGDDEVDSFSVVADPDGNPVLWYAGPRDNPGVYSLTAFDGSSLPVGIDPDGIRVQLHYDQSSNLHASWLHYPIGYGISEILYAVYPPGIAWQPGQYDVVYTLSVSPTSSLKGPTLGVDDEGTYLFWTVVVRSGVQAGTVQTEYVYFSNAQPSTITGPRSIAMPSNYALSHEFLPNTLLDAGERVSLNDANVSMTTELQEITTNATAAGELAIAFRTPTQHLWRKERNQVNVAYFRNGSPSSYQPLSFTPTFSTLPYLVSSEDGHLYITWLEKQESDWNTVYFASTAPSVKDALSQSTGRENLRIVAQVSFGMLVGILLAPIGAALWAMAPLAILLITSPLRKLGSTRVQTVFTVISVTIAIAAYWLSKLATLPGMLDYVPFSAWIPEISVTLGIILRWLVPLLSSGIALVVAWYYTFRRSNQSTLYFLLIYIGIDALLTVAIYAVLIYGEI